MLGNGETAPALPRRPVEAQETAPPPPPPPAQPEAEAISDFWSSEKLQQQQRDYEEQQNQLELQRAEELRRQQMLAMQQQAQFEEMQRQQMEQQRLAQEQLMRDQMARQAQGHVAELERQLLEYKGHHDQHLLLLESYDQKVKALESEIANLQSNIGQQLASKDDLIRSLQGKVSDKSLFIGMLTVYRASEHVEE